MPLFDKQEKQNTRKCPLPTSPFQRKAMSKEDTMLRAVGRLKLSCCLDFLARNNKVSTTDKLKNNRLNKIMRQEKRT